MERRAEQMMFYFTLVQKSLNSSYYVRFVTIKILLWAIWIYALRLSGWLTLLNWCTFVKCFLSKSSFNKVYLSRFVTILRELLENISFQWTQSQILDIFVNLFPSFIYIFFVFRNFPPLLILRLLQRLIISFLFIHLISYLLSNLSYNYISPADCWSQN